MALTLSVRAAGRNRNPIPTARELERRINDALSSAAQRAQAQLDRHTAYYTGGVQSTIEREPFAVELVSTDMRLVYNNSGTRPHTIRARSSAGLAFQPNYAAKTQPGVIPSRPGGTSGNFVYGVQQVEHPGTDPRNIDEAIIAAIKDQFISDMRKAVTG
ncbi:MAG: hypothetical protein R2932_32090 [Caldilineaceae bacterium]